MQCRPWVDSSSEGLSVYWIVSIHRGSVIERYSRPLTFLERFNYRVRRAVPTP